MHKGTPNELSFVVEGAPLLGFFDIIITLVPLIFAGRVASIRGSSVSQSFMMVLRWRASPEWTMLKTLYSCGFSNFVKPTIIK